MGRPIKLEKQKKGGCPECGHPSYNPKTGKCPRCGFDRETRRIYDKLSKFLKRRGIGD